MARTYATQTNAEPISAGMLEQFGNFDNYSIVSGCAGTFSAVNLTVTIASGTVVHNGSTVTVAGNSVTIVPDVTAPLWAWIGINSSGTAAITHGTAAATPTVPALGDVVPIYLVYVQANLGNANAATYKLDKRVIYSGLKGILTTSGDILYASAANTPARLAKGTARQALIMDSSAAFPSWAASLQSLMTGTGDIVYSSSANTPARLAAGTNGQVLTLASGIPSWAAGASAANTQTFSSSGTWTKPSGTSASSIVIIQTWGAGGGGGSGFSFSSGTTQGGTGGGGGAYNELIILASSLGATETVTVGTGGSGGNGGNGSDGGNTTFGSWCSGYGGQGGGLGNSSGSAGGGGGGGDGI